MAPNTTSSHEHHVARPVPPLISGISDSHLSLLLPMIIHWLVSAIFEVFERMHWFEQYRLHTSAEELLKNRVTRRECLRVTLQNQLLQTLLGLGLGALFGDTDDVPPDDGHGAAIWIDRAHKVFAAIPSFLAVTGVDFEALTMAQLLLTLSPTATEATSSVASCMEVLTGEFLYWYLAPILQIAFALVVADAIMYCIHRLGHTNKWLYKHFHSHHHRLYVPYAWGGSYNHPFDSLVTDGLSYALGCWAANLSTRQSLILFSYSSFKNVFDHCGYVFPYNPIALITGTDPGFHDVHHQSYGLKANFGAHLAIWDHMLGTYFGDERELLRLRARNRAAVETTLLHKNL